MALCVQEDKGNLGRERRGSYTMRGIGEVGNAIGPRLDG